jgi:hypothetical protein
VCIEYLVALIIGMVDSIYKLELLICDMLGDCVNLLVKLHKIVPQMNLTTTTNGIEN